MSSMEAEANSWNATPSKKSSTKGNSTNGNGSRLKPALFFSGRVHPGETPASWMMKGILEFLTGESPQAQLLRQLFVIYIVPILNPDGVVYGNNRCALAGELSSVEFIIGSVVRSAHVMLCCYLLNCVVLFCIVLYCIVLYCIVSYFIFLSEILYLCSLFKLYINNLINLLSYQFIFHYRCGFEQAVENSFKNKSSDNICTKKFYISDEKNT